MKENTKNWSLMNFEWRWSLATMALGLPTAIASFALPAWAVGASQVFSEYAPLSWVIAGFAGLLSASAISALAAWARSKWVRSKYDAKMLASGGAIDPLEKTFERKRIYLNEFATPSHPFIEGKSFIDCEIIGPANIILQFDNTLNEPKMPNSDAVLMHSSAGPFNGYIFRNCHFRGCNFLRITFLVPIEAYESFRGLGWLNWITPYPDGEDQVLLPFPPTDEALGLQSPEGTEEETPL